MNNTNNENVNEIDFIKLQMDVPKNIQLADLETQKEVYIYLENLDIKEKIAYKIAMEHLATSFNILRSNGFLEWKKKYKSM
jgi:hypothetical protein